MSPYARDDGEVFPGVIDDVPSEFAECISSLNADYWTDITFCLWRRHSDAGWQHGNIEFPNLPDPDGSRSLLSFYDGQPETYASWANDYYNGRNVKTEAVRWLFEHRPLSVAVVRELNPDRSLSELADEIRQIGYGSNGTPENSER